jgi:signal transduction histidine kinase
MALRPRSFTTRLAFANAALLASALLANAFYVSVRESHERGRELRQHALAFARLSAVPLLRVYESSRAADDGRVQELVRGYLALERPLQRIVLLDAQGSVLLDTQALPERAWPAPGKPPEARIAGFSATDSLRSELRRVPGAGYLFEVAVPVRNASGEREASVFYRFSMASLDASIRASILAALSFTLLTIGVGVLVSLALAARLTRPIQELTRGALAIGEGHFDRRLHVAGGNELRQLAETFNQMADRLKQNIAELEESNRQLAAVNEELKELDRMKSDLLANVSHELRTPLTAIRGYTDYLLEGKLGPVSDKQQKAMTVIQRNLERLSRSISALLDFSTMEVGRIALNLQPFSLPTLVEQLRQTLHSELEHKQLRFLAELEADLPQVIGDRDKLAQVLENLVVNAIKFTPPGGVIEIQAQRDEGREQRAVAVTVRDSGIGIPGDQIGKIFNRFHQVDGSSTRRFGGVGLGLAIVRSILDAHGAPIRVESEQGKGTAFRFWLPVRTREEAQSAPLPGYPWGRP